MGSRRVLPGPTLSLPGEFSDIFKLSHYHLPRPVNAPGGLCYTLPDFLRISALGLLVTGLILFLGLHSVRELGLRNTLITRFPSRAAYMGAYSVLSLAGLTLIVWGKSSSDFIMLFQPEFDQRWVSYLLMLPALILVVAGNFPMSFLRWHLRNPMMLGAVTWSVAHLWSNGDLASVVLFAGFGIWAAIKFISLWSVNKPASPFGWPLLLRDVLVVLIGFVLYGALWVWHGYLFGVGLGDGRAF